MNDLRQAAQQALEAWDDPPMEAKDFCVAMDALRAALAQQAERVEPVAWMDPASGDVISDARHEAWERDFGLAGKGKAALFTVPLYTAPPQRKPLTSDKDRPDQGTTYVEGYGYVDTRAVRAVERAHGVGEGA